MAKEWRLSSVTTVVKHRFGLLSEIGLRQVALFLLSGVSSSRSSDLPRWTSSSLAAWPSCGCAGVAWVLTSSRCTSTNYRGGRTAAAQLRDLRVRIADRDVATTVLAGDANFVDPAEGRWSVRRKMAVYAAELVGALFDDLFPEFAEIAQGSCTRRRFREEDGRRELDTVSRIDRVWSNASTPFLIARGASAWTEESVYASDMVSDHAGLGFRWGPMRRTKRHTVPRRVACDPRFPATVEAMVKEAGLDAIEDAFERLGGVAACIVAAAKRVERQSREPSVAATPEWQAHWLAACRAACLRRDRRAFADAVARIPGHAALFDSAALQVLSEAAYGDALQNLVHDRFMDDQRHDLRVAEGEYERRAVRRRYGALLSAWSPRRRTFTRAVVLDEAGEVLRTDELAAAALAAHWGATFTSSGGADPSAMDRLRNFVASTDIGMDVASLDDVRRILARAPRSAPGPDGISYEHWAHAGGFATRALHGAYLAVLGGASPPAGFCDGILVFIPKAALQPGQDEHRAAARDLRPRTLGNTSHKTIMLMINNMLERYACAIVHPSQRGFVRGRDLLTNAAELEGAITGFLHDDEAEPAAVLLDIAAAFPSAGMGIHTMGAVPPRRPGSPR